MEKAYKGTDTKETDEDEAILAFSNQMPGNEDAPKPTFIDVDKIKKEKDANAELDALNNNDATAAFGALVQAESI